METQTLPDIDTDVEIIPYEELDDPNHLTHIVNVAKNYHIWKVGMSATDIVDVARMTGQEVIALCGYRWIPLHNPAKYNACKPCLDIAKQILNSVFGESNG